MMSSCPRTTMKQPRGVALLSHPRARLRTLIAIATTVAVTLGMGAAVTSASAAALPAADSGRWIVRLAEPSLAASQALSGGKVDVNTASARAYVDRLAARQAEVA